MLQGFQAGLQSKLKQIMAPLKESLAQESVFESSKLVDRRILLKAVVSATNGYVKKLLKEPKERELLWSRCQSERNAVWDGRYGQRMIIENLEWAVEGIEKALSKQGDLEARNLELEEAERLVQPSFSEVNSSSFLRALAHLYSALIYGLRENQGKVAMHLLEMFIASPCFARNELGTILWEQIFQPCFATLDTWYHKEMSKLLNQPVEKAEKVLLAPNNFEALYTDTKGSWHQLQPSNARSGPLGELFLDREERLEILSRLYGESLDENTRKLAEVYKEGLACKRKSKRLHLPAVKLPQLHIQIVQREILSRRSLAVSPDSSDGSAWSQTSSLAAMKENVRPEETNARPSESPLELMKKALPERVILNTYSLLDGTELDEIKLLRTWNSPKGQKACRRLGSPLSIKDERAKVAHVQWEDKLPAHVTEEAQKPRPSENRTEMLAAMRGDEFAEPKQKAKVRDLSRNQFFQKLPPASALKAANSTTQATSSKKAPIPGTLRSRYSPQAQVDNLAAKLKQAVATLCFSEEFEECEKAVPVIARIWMQSRGSHRVQAVLTKPAVIDLLMEIISVSKSQESQRAAVCLLTELVQGSVTVKESIKNSARGVESVCKLLHIPQAVVLLYLLKLEPQQLAELNVIPELVDALRNAAGLEDGSGGVGGGEVMLRAPKAAATFLLEQLVTAFDCSTNFDHAELVLSLGGTSGLLKSVGSETEEEKMSALLILSQCRKCLWQRLKDTEFCLK